ncbi:MAG TPA: hypothetical protein VKT32_16375 [Chthonomonadaceae bacterium]|nr:hypothetical protein [Chthonomonadaceae bacterium]
MRLPGFNTSKRPPSVLRKDGPYFPRASSAPELQVTRGGKRSAGLARTLGSGLAVLGLFLAALRLWPASVRPPATPLLRTAPFAAASASAPETPLSEPAETSSTVPMPPPLPTRILIIHARDYPLHPVVTGGDPATGALPVPPVRAVVQVDSSLLHTFAHPPSVPVTAPAGPGGR